MEDTCLFTNTFYNKIDLLFSNRNPTAFFCMLLMKEEIAIPFFPTQTNLIILDSASVAEVHLYDVLFISAKVQWPPPIQIFQFEEITTTRRQKASRTPKGRLGKGGSVLFSPVTLVKSVPPPWVLGSPNAQRGSQTRPPRPLPNGVVLRSAASQASQLLLYPVIRPWVLCTSSWFPHPGPHTLRGKEAE